MQLLFGVMLRLVNLKIREAAATPMNIKLAHCAYENYKNRLWETYLQKARKIEPICFCMIYAKIIVLIPFLIGQ
jgi:hypothetical protein